MPALTPIQRLHRLDRFSPQFSRKLTRLLHGPKYRNYVKTLSAGESSWLVEYLDSVLDILQPGSPAFRACFHELWTICGFQRLLPQSHTLQANLLGVAGRPFATRGPCDVYEGIFDNSKVWIKRPRTYSMAGSDDTKTGFCREVVIWKRLSHPNIVPFLGVTVAPLQSASIWMIGGELPEYISTHPHSDRLGFLSDIANGLNYLHSRHLIHGDLKGTSVFVDDTGRARLADFGFSRVVSEPGSPAIRVDGHAVRWAAPEVLNMIQPVSEASDAYSFGMVILEIFTGNIPFPECIPTTVIVDVSSGCRPQRPTDPNLTDDLWDLTEQCWTHNPRGRPKISEVILRLQAIITSQSGDRVSRDDTTLGSFRQKQPSFEGRPRQSSQPTTTPKKRWRFWKFGGTSTPRFSSGGLSHDSGSEKGGRSADLRYRSYATQNSTRISGGWFSKFKSLFKRNRYEWA